MSTADFPPNFLADLDAAVMAREGKPEHGEVRFRCPSGQHEDHRPSARWNREKATWCCDVCKAGGGALDLADRLGVEKPRRPKPTAPISTIVATYDYHDPAGNLLFQVVRYAPKAFKQRRPDGRGGWVWNLDGIEPVLYRLPELLAEPTRWVTICAGEKDANRLCGLGFLATTAPMGEGEGKWRASYTEILRDRAVVILAHNDATGHKHAQSVAAALAGIARRVKVVTFAELPEKGDVSDWLDLGHTKTDLLRRMKETPDWTPAPTPLDEVHTLLGRFVAYPSKHAHVAHTLWTAHTHLMDAWESTPRLALLSPEPASGKTRALEVTELLVPNPIEAINVSAAYLFRKVDSEAGWPTILFDEVDTVFGPKAREHEDVRGLLNAGHRKGAVAGRCIVRGKTVETVEYPA